MPKMKTHSGAKKRFSKTATGKVKGAHAFRRHLLTKKKSARKADLRKPLYLKDCDACHIKPLLPYA